MPVSRKRQKNAHTRPQVKAGRSPRCKYSPEKARRLLAAASEVDPPLVLRTVMAKQGRTQGDLDAMNLLMAVLALGIRAGDTVTFSADVFGLVPPVDGSACEQARGHLRAAYGINMTAGGHDEVWTLTPRLLTLARLLPLARLRTAWETRERLIGDAMALLEAAIAGGVDPNGWATVSYADLATASKKPVSIVLDLEAYLVEAGAIGASGPKDTDSGVARWRLATSVLG